ncbi:MAG: FMN-binding protein [Adlercreutzia equolifaciens]
MDGETIANIEVPSSTKPPTSAARHSRPCLPIVIEAQSVDVDAISGATTTSNAFFTAVSDALSQA